MQLEDIDSAPFAQADAKQAAVGKVTREALSKSGKWVGLLKRTVVTKPTVNDVAADVHVAHAGEAERVQRVSDGSPLWIENAAARDDVNGDAISAHSGFPL